ncbi:hypothetical protein HU200_047334 [Digitaria exilis]|uniref:Uncharacterized protein n=1 Tax=Digitaria exilis TaxID=1010633 RepID=A0A835E8J1_9POAL|nr:hypothetical protein HU200_047334 [Digitaria exilis]
MPATDYGPAPQMFIRVVEVQGLDPSVREEVRSPTFELAVEVDRVSDSRSKRWPCASASGGGEDTMLRVSYHGIVLAWGSVRGFCIDRGSLQGPSVVATAEGSVVRGELRSLIRAEIDALGRAELDVEGNLPGFNHVRCKTYLFQGEPTEQLPPCRFQKKTMAVAGRVKKQVC